MSFEVYAYLPVRLSFFPLPASLSRNKRGQRQGEILKPLRSLRLCGEQLKFDLIQIDFDIAYYTGLDINQIRPVLLTVFINPELKRTYRENKLCFA